VIEPAFLIDANIAIYALRDSGSAASRRIELCTPGSVVTSSIVYAEILRGLPVGEPVPHDSLYALFDLIPVLPFDKAAAEAYRRVPFRRGTFDRLIAAHALSLDLVLVTNNERDFVDVPGLRVENWARE
jgi:tRNA(fMet)-specific endonuclease VapC